MATDLRGVSDEDLRLRCGEMTASELRACRAGYALAIAARPAQAGEIAGFVIGDSQGKRWRFWGESGPEWTTDRDAALRFSRREDAEAVARDDEDAWLIQQVGAPHEQAGEVAVPDRYEVKLFVNGHGHRHLASTRASNGPWVRYGDAIRYGDARAAAAASRPATAVPEGWRAEIRDNGFVAVVISPNGREWYGTELSDGWVWEIAHEMLSAARQPQPPVVKDCLPAGWRIQQNADGSIGLFSPPPSAGQSPRTSHAFYPGQRGDANELVYKLLEDMLRLKAGQGATSEGLEALADRIALKRRDGSADSHWLATLELDLRAFGVAGLHAPTSWSDRVDGEPAQMLVRPGIGATAKCTCDGARYEPDQRHPFLINRSCPVHGASQAPPESTKTGGAPGPECAFGTSGLELAPLGGPSDSPCGGET